VQEEDGEEGSVSLNMPAPVVHMPKAALATDEIELKEGEYEVPFGRVVIERTDSGFKIVIHISGKKLGQQLAKQIAHTLVGPYIARGRAT